MSDASERRRTDGQVLRAINQMRESVDDLREKQEKTYAVAVALQEHKTIERVDLLWESLAEFRSSWKTARFIGSRTIKFGAWGCATLLVIVGLVIAYLRLK